VRRLNHKVGPGTPSRLRTKAVLDEFADEVIDAGAQVRRKWHTSGDVRLESEAQSDIANS
jgi:hypothetical protein